MIGKFVIFTLLCVSLTQVQGNELEEAIKNGLIKVNGLYESGQKKINGSIQAIGLKSKDVERKTIGFLLKSVSAQKKAERALREAAKVMEEKAEELNKNEDVFECIKKTEKDANTKIQALNNKFKVSLISLEKETFLKIRTESKPLYEMQEAIKVEYQKVVKTIQDCKSTSCVENAVSGCGNWLDQMNAEIGRIFVEVGNAVGSFGKLAGSLVGNLLNQVNQIKSNGIRDIKNCVYG